MSKADELRAELAAAELEERFLEAKAAFENGDMSYEDYREVKVGFHDARVAHRQQREARAAEVADGDAAVTPETVAMTADASREKGGDAE